MPLNFPTHKWLFNTWVRINRNLQTSVLPVLCEGNRPATGWIPLTKGQWCRECPCSVGMKGSHPTLLLWVHQITSMDGEEKSSYKADRAPSQYKDRFVGMDISMIKIRWSWDCLIFIMGIPMQYVYSEPVPRSLADMLLYGMAGKNTVWGGMFDLWYG